MLSKSKVMSILLQICTVLDEIKAGNDVRKNIERIRSDIHSLDGSSQSGS